MIITLELKELVGISILIFLFAFAVFILIKPKIDLSNEFSTVDKSLNTFWIFCFLFLLYIFLLQAGFIPKEVALNKDSIPLLSSIGIVLSAFVASLSVMKSIANTNKIEKEKKEKESSEFYLNKSISELNNVYELLKDKNNDRVTWILAARVLNLALELSKKIKLENHKEFYHLQEFQLKHKLLDLFKSEEYKRLSFYVGCNNPLEISNSSAISEYFRNRYEGKHLAQISLYEIFSFLEYPDDFKDPLVNDKLPINDDELEAWIRKGGAIEYKRNIKEYFNLIEDKDGKYTEINYKNSTF